MILNGFIDSIYNAFKIIGNDDIDRDKQIDFLLYSESPGFYFQIINVGLIYCVFKSERVYLTT